MAAPMLESRTFTELQQMIADLSGLRSNLVRIHRIGLEGNFGATVIGESAGAQQSNVDAICERLRANYIVKG
jgi:hypothetical protein